MERVTSPSLDLKWSLTLRVAAVALLCFLVAATVALVQTYRDVRRANAHVADEIGEALEVQLLQIDTGMEVETGMGLRARFPYWTPVTGYLENAGQCARFLAPGGGVARSSCIGMRGGADSSPAWFAALCKWFPAALVGVARPVADASGHRSGVVMVTTERAALTETVWTRVSGLLALTALMVGTICVLQHAAISGALRPTRHILAGLARLSRGELSCRLPRFRLLELQRISEVFNLLAATLERATRENRQLAARLVDAQEQERLHLAQDLHDELAQSLAAMSAVAASIKATAETDCPALVPEADRLSRISIALMRSLRATLRALRPPEIDDFGLGPSLSALARQQERLADDRLRIELAFDGDLRSLPATAASHVYRIVQEGLTNINKHANARRARVTLGIRPEEGPETSSRRRWLDLTIEDDGRGAVEGETVSAANGLGLIGMRERVTALGGRLDIGRVDERGFRLHAVIPLDAQAGLAC